MKDIMTPIVIQFVMTELFFRLTAPKVQFREAVYTGEEGDGQITATVYRSGDIRHKSTVRCYTRQGSAEVASDFDERPNTDASIITFLPGPSHKYITCVSPQKEISCILHADTVLIKETARRSKQCFCHSGFEKPAVTLFAS